MFNTMSHAFSRGALAALAFLAFATACGSDSPFEPEPEPVPVAEVTVASSATSLIVGQSATVTATLKSAAGQVLTGRNVAWASSVNTVATVSAAGEVTALAAGTTRIGATSEGKQGDVELVVLPRSALVANVTLDATTATLNIGETRQLTATPRDAQGAAVTGVTVEWTVVAPSAAASVSASGLVTALQAGFATIVASVNGKQAQATVTVLENATHDLVFDLWESTTGNLIFPFLHQLDLRTPGAVPVRIGLLSSASNATPSPDGSKIAFVCVSDGSVICVAERDGSNATTLPGFGGIGGMLGDQPAWSPDGTRIAFRGWMPGGSPGIFNPTDVWVMNANGSGKVKLTNAESGTRYFQSPTWSPAPVGGGYRIAFSHVTRGEDGYERANIASVRADGQNLLPVTQPGDYSDSEPTWSPDGNTIAFVRTGGTASGDLWLVNSGAGNERQLMSAAVEPTGAQRSPAWSPDGALIAFASSHEIIANYFAWQIYTVRADGTTLLRRTENPAEKGNPSWLRRP